jgi:hypothetical protein
MYSITAHKLLRYVSTVQHTGDEIEGSVGGDGIQKPYSRRTEDGPLGCSTDQAAINGSLCNV